MFYDYMLRDRMVPCRGRSGLPDTVNFNNQFTERELDEIAPLEPGDGRWLGEDRVPSYETILRVERRIKAAQLLKYGVCNEA